MGTYLVEAYLARPRDAELAQAARRAQTAAEELTRQGLSVRYLRTLFLPEDETCFHLYEAATADDVREAGRRAGIVFERLVDAVEISARSKRAQATSRGDER